MKKILIIMIICISIVAIGCTNNTDSIVDNNNKTDNNQNGDTKSIYDNASSLAQMYMLGLDSLMDIDEGLNGDMNYISIDLQNDISVTEQDIQDIMKYFEDKYSIKTYSYSIDECFDNGLGDKDNRALDGIVLSLINYPNIQSEKATFEASKYRSGLGSIGVEVNMKKVNDMWEVINAKMNWIS